MTSDFQVGMKSLQHPSFLSRFISIPGIEILSQVYSFWKWGALIFAIYATFSSLIKRIKLVLIRLTVKPSANLEEEVIDFSEGDEISSASSDDELEGEDSSGTTSSQSHHCTDRDFRVKGSRVWFDSQGQNCHLRRRSNGTAWSEFAPGKSIVKICDSLGLSLDFDEDLFDYDPKSVVSTWESDRDRMASDFSAGMWNSPASYLTAEGNQNGEGVILGGYDTRMRRRTPAIYAQWSSPAEKVASVSAGGNGRVYVRDDVSRIVTVGDMRNVRRPLEHVADSKGDTWLDASGVLVE